MGGEEAPTSRWPHGDVLADLIDACIESLLLPCCLKTSHLWFLSPTALPFTPTVGEKSTSI